MAIIHEPGPGGLGGRSTRALSATKYLTISGASVLDLGCKEGYNSLDFSDLGACKVLGVEARASFVEEALREKTHGPYGSVDFVLGDARTIDEAGLGSFDICLCSGLLYHMQDPVDLLRRIGKISKHLVLETHVALPVWLDPFVGGKYRCNLQRKIVAREFCGASYQGRRNIFPASVDMGTTSGSVDSHETFWLTIASLKKALQSGGFETKAFYFGFWGTRAPAILVDHGVRRAKIFAIATQIPGAASA
jgi:SAM-dependent methyltransferase